MSDAEIMVSDCLKKKYYKSKAFAEQVAAKVFKERGVNLKAYSCPFCFQWHLAKRK